MSVARLELLAGGEGAAERSGAGSLVLLSLDIWVPFQSPLISATPITTISFRFT